MKAQHYPDRRFPSKLEVVEDVVCWVYRHPVLTLLFVAWFVTALLAQF